MSQRGRGRSGLPAREERTPIVALRNAVLFPGTVMPLVVGRRKTMDLLADADSQTMIGVLTQRDHAVDDPGGDDLYEVGTMARVLKVVERTAQGSHIIVQGVRRFRVKRFLQSEPYLVAAVASLAPLEETDVEIEALARSLRQAANELVGLLPELPSGAADLLERTGPPVQLAYLLLSNIGSPIEEKMEVLDCSDSRDILRKALEMLHRQLEVLRVSQKINTEVRGDLSKTQREYVLRKQLDAIHKELNDLGVVDEDDPLAELRMRIANAGLTDEAREVAEKEMKRLSTIQPSSPEYTVARTYLDWLASLPWSKTTEDNLDVAHAREVLDMRHYGIQKVKRRILEYIAVRKLKSDMKGPILCLVGPPGVGKTSLGSSIAEALGREFVRMALGGIRDEAQIRGHRRTYIGAMPGKIIQLLKRAGSQNPVFLLDEVDKIGRDWRGDPTSAMLEVLDPEQNATFVDHYLDVKFDLSRVLFLATANQTDTIPAPLLDRMEVIELNGYTMEEKRHIARKHLLPRQLDEHGLTASQLSIADEPLEHLIGSYTREAGVRGLNRRLADICRAFAVEVVEQGRKRVRTTEKRLEAWLGPERYETSMVDSTGLPGIATGMAWTSTGGDILFIEASRMPGNGKLRITGQLGEVMKESCEIALSCVRTWAAAFGVDDSVFEGHDLHIHVPAGGIPKDGPSAGVTIFTALVSLLSNAPVRRDVAMTGEITLRGLVLPVGGVKDKVLAAQRGGIQKVILPERNRKDLLDIPDSVRKTMEIVFVDRMADVLIEALETVEGLPFHSQEGTVAGAPFHVPAEA